MIFLLLLLLWGSPINTLAEQGTVLLLVGGVNPRDWHKKPVGYYDRMEEKIAEIFDPNGIITCTLNANELNFNNNIRNLEYSTLNYLPNTGEIMLCGGLERAYRGQCLLLNNMKFGNHSKLTQPHPNLHHTAVVNEKLWLFGGDRMHEEEGYLIESLDGAIWSVEDAPRTPTAHDMNSCSVYTGDALILIGGAEYRNFYNFEGTPSANVSKLIPGSNKWESLAPLPSPREYHGCVYLPPSKGFPEGSILVAGGNTGRTCATCFTDSLIYDISKDIWIPAGEMEVSHSRGALVNVDGRILFAGGLAACVEKYCNENLCNKTNDSYGPLQYWCKKLKQFQRDDYCNNFYVVKEVDRESPMHYWCDQIGHTDRVDEFHLENLGTEKPTWTELNYKLKTNRDFAAAAAIPIEYWNNGRSCRIANPLPTPPPTTTVDCFDEDNDYPGLDINLASAKTTDRKENAEECQALCKTNKECNFFTWSSANKRCYLKSGKSRVNDETGAISGPKNC